jgi:hypothetical protein
MTKIVSTATVSEIDGLVVLLHLDTADAYECLRVNLADEVSPGDINGVIESISNQDIALDVFEHDVNLADVRMEYPDLNEVYDSVYSALDSHAWGSAAGIEHCVCGGWTSTDDHNFTDHVTRAVLAALGLLIKAKP